MNVDKIGQLTGGLPQKVFVSGNYAYVAAEGILSIVDISTPSAPAQVGYYDTPGIAYGVYVSGNYAYVADYGSGLRVIDISTPSSPSEVGFYDTPGTAYGVYVSGNYAYVADSGSGLRVIDVTTPSAPSEVGFYDTAGNAFGVYVFGNYAYVADNNSGLRVIDVTTPSAPSEVGFYDTPGQSYGVYISGNYAYVADWNSGLRVIDITTASSPSEVGFYDTTASVHGVHVIGNYAYVAYGGSGLRVIDVTTPSSPSEVGFYDTPGWAYGVYISGNYACVADEGGGLRVIDITTPSLPSEVGFYDTPGDVRGVQVSGNYAYMADYYSGLRVINITTPSSPSEAGFYVTTSAMGVHVSGNYAYVPNANFGLPVIDISTPSSPSEVGFYNAPGDVRGVQVSGNYAYVATSFSGLRVLDITTPPSPSEVGFYDTPGTAYGVHVSGNYAYVADGASGLRVIDITTPSSPSEVGFYDTPGIANGVRVSGNYAYVADGTSGLRVIDVSTPSSPSEVGFYNTPGQSYGVYISGNYAYVADLGSGLRVFDISTPSSPSEVGFYDTPGYAQGVHVFGNYAYVADEGSGLFVLDFLLDETTPPTVTDNQTGDDTWHTSTPVMIYDVDFSDAGGSLLNNAQYAVWSAPGMSAGTGTETTAWTDIITGINAPSYTAAWGVEFASLSQGVNYVSVRAYDNAGNVSAVATDVFYVKKATVPPAVTDNQTGDDTWRGADPGAIYDVDFSDAGGSLLDYAQYAVWSATGMTGSELIPWTYIAGPGMAAGSYTADWGVNFASFTEGTNYISVRAADIALNVSAATDVFYVKKDTTAPADIPTVSDGTGGDVDFTSSKTQLSANWSGSADAESGIAKYWYSIGISAGASDTAGWTNNGTGTLATKTGLSLTDGVTYYVTVKAENVAGLMSGVTTSDGQTVDVTPPYAPAMSLPIAPCDGDVARQGATCSATVPTTNSPTLTWSTLSNGVDDDGDGATDEETYDFADNDADGLVDEDALVPATGTPASDVYRWHVQIAADASFATASLAYDNSSVVTTSIALGALPARSASAPYYWRVAAFDSASNEGDWSPPAPKNYYTFAIDTTAPSITGISAAPAPASMDNDRDGTPGELIDDAVEVTVQANEDFKAPFLVRVMQNGVPPMPTPDDLIDNDCDGLIDEETQNSMDDDGDGLIDEDTGSSGAQPGSGCKIAMTRDPVTTGLYTGSYNVLPGYDGTAQILVGDTNPESPYHAGDIYGNEVTATGTFTVDTAPPVFAGVQGVASCGDGCLEPSWAAATDAQGNTPITYNIYAATATGAENFSTPSYQTASTSYQLPGLTFGQTYYYVVRAADASGNMDTNVLELSGTPADTVAPTVTDNQTGDDMWRGADPGAIYDVDFSDAGGSNLNNVQYTAWSASGMSAGTGTELVTWTDIAAGIGAAAYTTNWGVNFASLTEGVNYVSVRAYDNAGNASAVATDVFYVKVDTLPPAITDNQTGDDTWRGSDPGAIYDIDFSDAGGALLNNVQYSVFSAIGWTDIASGIGAASYTTNWGLNFASLTDGTNYVDVRAYDNAGNMWEAMYAFYVKVDTLPPSGGVIDYTDGYHTMGGVVVWFSSGWDTDSGIASYVIRRRSAVLNAGVCGAYGSWSDVAANPNGSTWSDATVSDGNCYQYQLAVTDAAGNSTTYCTDGASCSTPNTAKVPNDILDCSAYGDFTQNGQVNLADLAILKTNYGQAGAFTCADGDTDGDGLVNITDLLVVKTNYYSAASSGGTPETPPSTSTAALSLLSDWDYIKSGDAITIDVVLDTSSANIDGVDVHLGFATSVLNVTDVTVNPQGTFGNFISMYSNASGTVDLGLMDMSGDLTGFNGSIATITMDVTQTATATITFDKIGSSNRYTGIIDGKIYKDVNTTDLTIGYDHSVPYAPSAVNDGSGVDIDYTTSTTQLSANWSVSYDAESGVAQYWYGIGTTAGATDTLDWTDAGTATGITKTGLSLTSGQTYYFTVKAEDGAGFQSAVANSDGVTVDTTPPAVSITSPADGYKANSSSLALSGTTESGAAVTVNGQTATVTGASFSKTITLSEGNNTVTAVAADPAGNSASDTISVSLDSTDPTAEITAPTADSVWSGTITVTGTAADANFQDYALEYGTGTTPAAWKTFATSTTAVPAAALGSADMSRLEGVYTIRLTVNDNYGNSNTDTVSFTVTGNKPSRTVAISPNYWTLVSMPFSPDAATLADILNKSNYKLYRWEPDAPDDPVWGKYVIPAALSAGQGFWMKPLTNKMSLKLTGAPADSTVAFEYAIGGGWNQIGVPFNWNLSWQNVKIKKGGQTYTKDQAVSEGFIESTPFRYVSSPAGWKQVTEDSGAMMQPGEGFFLYAPAGGVTLVYNPGSEDPTGLARIVRVAPELRVKVSARTSNAQDADNIIGMNENASDAHDGADLREPPGSMGRYVSLFFPHDEWGGDSGPYTNDFRRTTGKDTGCADAQNAETCKIWNFTVETDESGDTVTLSWNPLDDFADKYTITLTDLKTGATTDMIAQTEYRYTASSQNPDERRFRITVIKKASTLQTASHTLEPGWNLISIPLETEVTNALQQLGDDLNVFNVFQYYDERYNSVDSGEGVDLQAGIGYWIHVAADTTIDIEGTPTDPAAAVEVPLKPGWNLIGNPFDEALAWGDNIVVVSGAERMTLSEAASGRVIGSEIFEAGGGGSYTRHNFGDLLEPWKGYFVKSSRECVIEMKK